MKSKAIFLDLDGVINFERKDYVKIPDEFELIPGVTQWLKLLIDNGYKLIIITNQSMIGRGLSTEEKLDLIHKKMQNQFFQNGLEINKIYYCTHKPEDNCKCRKPGTKLFEDAIREFNIDVNNSWLIGNNDSDTLAGKRIGCKTIKIETNSSLREAVLKILGNSH